MNLSKRVNERKQVPEDKTEQEEIFIKLKVTKI
jgi:hypothetical protein